MFETFEDSIQDLGGFNDVAGAHPDQLREVVVRLDVARRQSDAIAQRLLGLRKALQGDQAAGMGVQQRRGRLGAGQHLARHAFALPGFAGCIQGNRQRVARARIARGQRHEVAVVCRRLFLTAQRDVCGDVQRRQLGIRLHAVAPGCRSIKCHGRPAHIEMVTHQ
jgi:hypothetical protein